MNLAEYRSELETLLTELRQAQHTQRADPIAFALHFALTERKVGLVETEIREVEEMSVGYDLAWRFAELLRALDGVGT